MTGSRRSSMPAAGQPGCPGPLSAGLVTAIMLCCCLLPGSQLQSNQDGITGPGKTVPPFGAPGTARSPVRGLASPRQLLDLFGIDESHLRFLIDGEAILAEDIDVVSKILMRFPDLGQKNILRWVSPTVPWEELVREVEKHRVDFFRVEGIVRRVERQKIIPEAATLYGFDHFFWVLVETPGRQRVQIATRTIPSSWRLDRPISEPVAATAMYLKHAVQQDGTGFYLFASGRIEWYPRAPSEDLQVNEGMAALAGMGMDVSLFDDVRSRNRRSIGAQEQDCFYRLLELLEKDIQPLAIKPGAIELTGLLRSPGKHHGDYLEARGTVRRITRIEVPDEDLQLRFGIRHYYQLDLFLPLGDKTIQIKLNPDDEQGLKFTSQFPLVACVTRLPPQLVTAQKQLEQGTYAGKMLNESILIRGFFFKIWGYSSSFSSTGDKPRRQLSPMILAFEPKVVPQENHRDSPLAVTLSLGFAALLLGIWMFVWRSGRKDHLLLKERREQEPATSPEQFQEIAQQMDEETAEPT